MMWRIRWFRWLVFSGLWLVIGLTFASQLYLFYGRTNMPLSWRWALAWEVTRWSLWAVLSPIIFRLARHFRIERRNKLRPLLIHVLASVFVSLLHLTLLAFAVAYLTGVIAPEETLLQKAAAYLSATVTVFKVSFTLNFHVGIIVYWVIVAVNHTLDYYRKSSSLEGQLARSQLQALKMQLHPHFIFNTLNSISALMHQDVEAADEMIGCLGDFLRLTLENSGAQHVRMREELEFLRCYLEIEAVRLQDRLTVKMEIEPSVLDAQVPNLILQPIVENAIKHGIAPRESPGHITVSARRRNDKLELLVRDNGPGLPAGTDAGPGFTEGIGLSNTRARLEQLYGASHRFELANEPEGGLCVTLEIPFSTEAVTTQTNGET